MPEKLERCVRKVRAKGKVRSPWAVCVKSTGLTPYKSHRGKKR